MTFYTHKPVCHHTVGILQSLGLCGREELAAIEKRVEGIVGSMKELLAEGAVIGLWCDEDVRSTGVLATEKFQRAAAPACFDVIPLQDDHTPLGRLGFVIGLQAGLAPVPTELGDTPFFVLVPEGEQPIVGPGKHHVLQFPVPQQVSWDTVALLVLEALGRDLGRSFRLSGLQGELQEPC